MNANEQAAPTYEQAINSLATFPMADANVLLEEVAARYGKTISDVEQDLDTARAEIESARNAMESSALEDGRKKARTEFGNADRMLSKYGNNLMYVSEISTWFKWTGVYWRSATNTEIEHLAKETIKGILDEVNAAPSEPERVALVKFYVDSQKAKMVNNMLAIARSDPRVMVGISDLDRHRHLLGVGNGAVNLQTGELLPPNRDHRITLVTDVHYDPDAAAPLFESTVSDAFFDDQQQIDFFRRAIGYSILGKPIEQKMFVPHGSGANSKSTTLGAVRAVLGKHARAAAADTFLTKGQASSNSGGAPREDLLRLRGARFVYVAEPEEGSELREAMVKGMTGDDAVSARGIHAKRTIEFLPTWAIWMPTNHRPIIKGDDYAIWRRLLLMPFTRNFEKDAKLKNDKGRIHKLAKEAPGILAWCVRGALEYQKHGLEPTDVANAALDKYREDMDLLGEWIAERCALAPNCADSTGNLWVSWEEFAKERGELKLIPSARSLGRRLAGRGFERIQDREGVKGRGFRGVKVIEFGSTKEKILAAAVAAHEVLNKAAAEE